MSKISKIFGLEILDSRGNPTVEATVVTDDGYIGSASVPSGASTGTYEALELRDGDTNRYLGLGVEKAVKHVNEEISGALVGMEVTSQNDIDRKMREVDGTTNKSNLGANAILAVSMAGVRAAAVATNKPVYEYVAGLFGNPTDQYQLPVPMINVLNGGKHAIRSTDLQEYMFFPLNTVSMAETVEKAAVFFHQLGKVVKNRGFSTTVGDEGGYAPSLKSNEEPFELLSEAAKAAGYEIGRDISFGIDAAASSFYKDGKYELAAEGRSLSTEEMIEMYVAWVEKYPIISVEDMFFEDDWNGFVKLNQRIGSKVQTVGDDLYVTNVERLKKGIEMKASNSILIKVNQIGTVSETIEAIQLAKQAGMTAVISHRSGETEDTFIADFVVGAGTGQIKTGSMSRSERIAKYNRLLRIETELGDRAVIAKMPFTSKK